MDNIIAYFNGEKLQCVAGACISIVFIAFSISFLFQQKPFLKGIGYVSIPLSVLLLIICVGVVYKNSRDIERVTTFYKEAPNRIQVEEIPRMEKVMKSFGIIKKVEIAIFIIGLALAVIFWPNELMRGVAVGLIVMGASLYAFDHIAESRGEPYLQFLKAL
jgi:uncharacterized protein YxeA